MHPKIYDIPLAILNAQTANFAEPPWLFFDEIRAKRGKNGFNWDKRVFLPDMAYQFVYRQDPTIPQTVKASSWEISTDMLAAISAWRPSQDIIWIDYDVLLALYDTPVDRIPTEILGRLPSYCVYVPLSIHGIAKHESKDIIGIFIYYGDTLARGRESKTEIRFLPVTADSITQPTFSHCLSLDKPNLKEAFLTSLKLRTSAREMQEYTATNVRIDSDMRYMGWMVSIALYVITEFEKLYEDGKERLERPSAKYIKKSGWRLFPPKKPRLWELGKEVGDAIREVKNKEAVATVSTGDRNSPRPHIRRGHWHTYWTGTRIIKEGKEPIPRKASARWLPPIPVALKEETG